MSHTPGPWWLNQWGDVIYGADNTQVCRPSHPGYPTSKANARLIKAAPEMYTALRSARDNLALIVAEGLVLEYYDFTEIDAAIARVKGDE